MSTRILHRACLAGGAGAIVAAMLAVTPGTATSAFTRGTLATGKFRTLDEPNAESTRGWGTYASGVNNSGEIVGSYVDSTGVHHGLEFTPGQ